tara:strand:- start:2959 stop:4326 length:1368 start_codon:yes stop_codon:yes gene_type:complete
MNLNLNIDDYSDEDLYNLLELNDPSREEIIKKIEFLNTNHFKDNETVTNFFYEIEKRLLDNYNDNNYINKNIFNKFNYNVENQYDNSDYEDDEDDEDDENDEDDEDDEDNTNNEKKENFKESFANYNEIKSTDYDNSGNKIEIFYANKYLHFNTFFRQNNTTESSTNCRINLPEVTNVVQAKLIAINIRKPFLIHENKFNNKFVIKKLNSDNICDFSYNITIDNGYYNKASQLENFLNENYFINSDISLADISGELFMKSITFSINKNSKKIVFDLSSNYLQQDANFGSFIVDFKSNYTPNYSLATIMGFDYKSLENSINSLDFPENSSKFKIISPYEFNNLDTPLFFSFEDHQTLTIETQQLFLNNNISSEKILAKINFSLANSDNNFYINEIFENADRKNNVRLYNNPVNISNFNIKIIDIFNNVIDTINEDFTFELEFKIKYTQIVNQSEST